MLTLLIIAVTAIVSWLAFQNGRLAERLILWPPAVKRGQVDRLLTHGFIHADLSHLFFNMLTLFFFGRLTEQVIESLAGPVVFVFFYVSAVVVAILPSYLRHRDDSRYRSLGASGAVAAMLFAAILIDPWMMIFIPIPVPGVLYGIGYVGWSWWADRNSQDGVNHNAHLSGAIYGVLFMLVMNPAVGPHFLAALMSPHF
ncbi:rhomboid family intramembrane serine protease [Lysobacter sp. TY2-98]|uniref:rhomboid family intramembrane serine protease n=1 Tax=Lysobacter sp. TY2-98 TaxID=2290922 RepID=UPI000E1FF52D|nr:rhomboid family intramembrane serine protease [Lysobacter sp. TY2-98]AXK72046.1 rhomboid family intramembrane serine protease [Lysobacter sp. TY2-98]